MYGTVHPVVMDVNAKTRQWFSLDEPHPWHSCPSSVALVALASSAGGLTPLRDVLSRLPSNFPVPILVCPHRRSRPPGRDELVDLLDRRSRLEVVQARDGALLHAGRVYVAPPNQHLLVSSGNRIAVCQPATVAGSRPSANLLFESLAARFGSRLIAIVLSGMLSDGAAGVTKVKASGGTVIVQDPESAICRGMPDAAIASGCVDFVLPSDRIADALITLAMVQGATELFTTFHPAWVG